MVEEPKQVAKQEEQKKVELKESDIISGDGFYAVVMPEGVAKEDVDLYLSAVANRFKGASYKIKNNTIVITYEPKTTATEVSGKIGTPVEKTPAQPEYPTEGEVDKKATRYPVEGLRASIQTISVITFSLYSYFVTFARPMVAQGLSQIDVVVVTDACVDLGANYHKFILDKLSIDAGITAGLTFHYLDNWAFSWKMSGKLIVAPNYTKPALSELNYVINPIALSLVYSC